MLHKQTYEPPVLVNTKSGLSKIAADKAEGQTCCISRHTSPPVLVITQ